MCLIGVMCVSVEVKARGGKVLRMSMVQRKGVVRISVMKCVPGPSPARCMATWNWGAEKRL